MTLTSLLEKDKDQLVHDLEAAGSPQKARIILRSEMERILYQYNEQAGTDLIRTDAANMMQTASAALGLMTATGAYTLWQQGDAGGKGSSRTRKEKILLVTGIFLETAGAAMMAGAGGGPGSVLRILAGIVLLAGGGASLFLSGKAGSARKKDRTGNHFTVIDAGAGADQAEKLRIEQTVDPQALYTDLLAIVQTMDRNLMKETLSAGGSGSLSGQAAEEFGGESRISGKPADSRNSGPEGSAQRTMDDARLTLYSDLLEALCSKDGTFALERLREVTDYLHDQGIEAVSYSDEHADWFDRMPSAGEKSETLRPALVKDGTVLKKGLITGG